MTQNETHTEMRTTKQRVCPMLIYTVSQKNCTILFFQ